MSRIQKWEYRVTAHMKDEAMQVYGQKGWELVAAVQPFKPSGMGGGYPETVTLYWKRAVSE